MSLLDTLPEPKILKRLMKIHASLNIVLCPDDEWLRYHKFDPTWSDYVSMAKIDNGSGDHIFIVFSPQGAIIKGFDHESGLSPYAREEHEIWPGIYEGVPNLLFALLNDEAIESDDVTFCIWREISDSTWQKGKVEIPEGEDDGLSYLVGSIFLTPEDFVQFAQEYFELTPSLAIIKKIYDGVPITAEMITKLNPECNVEDVLHELELLNQSK
ncbi:hypothetical protein [Paenibacillus sp. BC26]|uniref:hypothetical protein n=1 Tax=Paenibacillus sp. BC26 TaxID=1881032 RepID=UPI0008F0B7F1|nr:hypothetical protein [Paenibacillus sp. BC26]SFS72614.1 hypothetical protein SAMN05428962_2490 [Paenibacillus sp. BC26]